MVTANPPAGSGTSWWARPLVPVGALFVFSVVVRSVFRRPFQWREFSDQAWFVARVSLLPTMLITIPFGAVLSLQIGTLFNQLGAQSFTGAAARRCWPPPTGPGRCWVCSPSTPPATRAWCAR